MSDAPPHRIPQTKLDDDPAYKDLCLDSRRVWRERNPDYMREYRKSRPDPRAQRLEQSLEYVKNCPAFELRRCPAEAWLVVPKGTRAKNTFAGAQIIVFDVVTRDSPDSKPEKNISLAFRNGNPYK